MPMMAVQNMRCVHMNVPTMHSCRTPGCSRRTRNVGVDASKISPHRVTMTGKDRTTMLHHGFFFAIPKPFATSSLLQPHNPVSVRQKAVYENSGRKLD